MRAPNPLDITLQSGLNLEVRALMTGPHRQFRTGKLGYLWRGHFDWKGKRWRLRFQAFVKSRRSGTTHGMLEDVREKSPVPSHRRIEPTNPKSAKVLGKLLEAWREVQRRKEAKRAASGWKLKKLPNGIEAVFDLRRLRTYPSGKIGSFASCNVEIDGALYLCQFHIREQHEPLPKPIEWDWSRGARAGIPTLGKRR